MIEIDDIKYERGLTHPGVFHADDVFATALLRRIDPDFKVERGPVPDNTDGILVFDTGGGEFDHHGKAVKLREDGTPYSSVGLLWEKLGDRLVDPLDMEKVERSLIVPIDKADNGWMSNPLSGFISNLHAGVVGTDEMNRAFEKAVEYAGVVLDAEVSATNLSRQNMREVMETMDAQKGSSVLVMDEYMNGWQTAVVGSEFKFVVFPSIRGGYNAQGVPVEQGSFDVMVPFPESWRGLSDAELVEASGIETAKFCHASGFLFVADTLEDAKQGAEFAIMHNTMELDAAAWDAFGDYVGRSLAEYDGPAPETRLVVVDMPSELMSDAPDDDLETSEDDTESTFG